MSGAPHPEARKIHDVVRRLAESVATVKHDLHQYHGHMEEVSRGLTAVQSNDPQDVAQMAITAVAEILQIQARLQERLLSAEERLRGQTKQIDQWMTQARTDALTGLSNRRAFDDALARQLAEWQRTAMTFSVILIDADRFKAINDRHGHAAGDAILRGLAQTLEGSFRRMDTIARIGGEEFAVILPSTQGEGACRAAEHVRKTIAACEFPCDDQKLRATVSLGVTEINSQDDAKSILRRADQALYAAKDAGRNRTFFHDGGVCASVGPLASTEGVFSPPEVQPAATSETQSDNGVELTDLCQRLRASLVANVQHEA